MKNAQPSQTAIGSAIMRAAHLTLDGEPKILKDHFALLLANVSGDDPIAANLELLQRPEFRQLRAYMVLRHRYVEDELACALAHRIAQYVILGAGLDTFAYRRPRHLHDIRVFEVDHPTTQSWKRARLEALGIAIPDNVRFVPVNFEQEKWSEKIEACGFDHREPTFFSCLGVSQYITRAAFEATLREMTRSGSAFRQVILDFVVPAGGVAPADRLQIAMMCARSEHRGEPWVSYYDPTELHAMLVAVGFEHVEHFSPERACERYFLSRDDGLVLPGTYHLMNALFHKSDT